MVALAGRLSGAPDGWIRAKNGWLVGCLAIEMNCEDVHECRLLNENTTKIAQQGEELRS
jgi:hypothetical protein